MSEQQQVDESPRMELVIDGETIRIDIDDINGVEWRDIKRVTDLRPGQVLKQMGTLTVLAEPNPNDPDDPDYIADDERRRQLTEQQQEAYESIDLEWIAALAWVVKKRDDAGLEFDDVLAGVSLRSLNVESDDDGEGAPVPPGSAGG